MSNINESRDGRYVGHDIPICESGGERRLRFVSGMPGYSGAIDGRTDALQAQIALGVLERDAQLPAATHVHTVSSLPYDLRREEGQSAAGHDELDADTTSITGLPEHQYHTNHLRVSIGKREN